MRILLVAYEFPPSPSAQSLRWAYLVRELAWLGHEVHVLTVQRADPGTGLPTLPPGVQLHRTFAGPLHGSLEARRARRLRAGASSDAGSPLAAMPATPPGSRNWKYRLVEALQRSAAAVIFPDQRGEWLPWARRKLGQLLDSLHFDVVIASHEPATSLQLGLFAQRRGIALLADLGDPVSAPYTPRRWQARSLQLERAICEHAAHITVTSAAMATLLSQRHGRNDRISVLTQGYDDRRKEQMPAALLPFDPQTLELLYTGNFYPFRRPDQLVDAIRLQPGVRLTIATPAAPRVIQDACRDAPEQFRMAGFLPHADVLALQHDADVLVNIANDDPCQIPGKLFEYLGSGRPVLYLGDVAHPAADIVAASGCGWVAANDCASIASKLDLLLRQKRAHGLPACVPVAEYGWSAIAARLDQILKLLPDSQRTSAS